MKAPYRCIRTGSKEEKLELVYQSVLSKGVAICLRSVLLIGLFVPQVGLGVDGDSIEPVAATGSATPECVVLLHGLIRSSKSMNRVARAFEKAGYEVVNVDYPSRHHQIEHLAPLAVHELGASQCSNQQHVNFVTHSLGGILARYYLAKHSMPNLGRVVMLAPPNQGSIVVDNLKNVPGFYLLNGPAGMQLGTDEQSIPSQLPAVDFELGVIAGSKSINPLLSLQIPNPDDGTISAASTHVAGMQDHLLLPVTHTFLMRSEQVIDQVLFFIRYGKFKREESEQ